MEFSHGRVYRLLIFSIFARSFPAKSGLPRALDDTLFHLPAPDHDIAGQLRGEKDGDSGDVLETFWRQFWRQTRMGGWQLATTMESVESWTLARTTRPGKRLHDATLTGDDACGRIVPHATLRMQMTNCGLLSHSAVLPVWPVPYCNHCKRTPLPAIPLYILTVYLIKCTTTACRMLPASSAPPDFRIVRFHAKVTSLAWPLSS